MKAEQKPCKPMKNNNKRKLTAENANVVSVNGKDYDIVDVEGDGNCLFRCFSYYLYKREDSHYAIRQKCVDYTVEHWSEEAPILRNTCEEDEDEMYRDAETYRKNMGSNRCMGTDYELGVFIRCLRIPATYFREYEENDLASIRQVQVLDNENVNNNAKRLNILFSGKRRNGHWQILLERRDDSGEDSEDEYFPAYHWFGSDRAAAEKKSRSTKKTRCPTTTAIITTIAITITIIITTTTTMKHFATTVRKENVPKKFN
ncbi:uncharacterized protein LOC100678180 [Nasonia vitripennis]|uniref:OTU domain-containing protein n=1 Tax=Nasonia vitripennis TaxID=7425 RepID=A0A7M7GFS9_NASVI|nr:uncharacterized protein LOC100678180 [Nasonia vitripennis]